MLMLYENMRAIAIEDVSCSCSFNALWYKFVNWDPFLGIKFQLYFYFSRHHCGAFLLLFLLLCLWLCVFFTFLFLFYSLSWTPPPPPPKHCHFVSVVYTLYLYIFDIAFFQAYLNIHIKLLILEFVEFFHPTAVQDITVLFSRNICVNVEFMVLNLLHFGKFTPIFWI